MLIDYVLGQTGIIVRAKVRQDNNGTKPGQGFTGLTSASTGLIVSTIADNEAAATAYTQAGSTIDAVATLGTYAAPTAGHCAIKKVDDTNHPGLVEIQLANARFAVASSKELTITLSGVTNMADCDVKIPLRQINPYLADFGLAAATLPASPTSGTFGSALSYADAKVGRRNTAQAGTTSTITLDAGAGTVDNAFKDHFIKITGGTGAGQFATITGYVGSTKVATIYRPVSGGTWTTTPDNTSVFMIEPFPLAEANVTQINGTAVTPVGSAVPATLSPTERNAIAAAVLTDTTDLGTAGSLGSIVSPINTNLNATITSRSTFAGGAVASVTGPVTIGSYSAGQDPATLVLDVAAASHNVANSVGAKINSAAASSDPLASPVPGIYAAGTAGYEIANKIGYTLAANGVDAVMVESGVNLRQAIAEIGATTTARSAGFGTSTVTFYAMGQNNTSTPRLVATVDTVGNRTAITPTLPS